MSDSHCPIVNPIDRLLLMAACENLPKVVSFLLQEGADINVKNHDAYSSLMLATWHGRFENVKILVEAGADVNASIETERDKGATPLIMAAQRGYLDITQYLLQKGANPSSWDKDGDTPLLLAATRGHHQIVEILKSYLRS